MRFGIRKPVILFSLLIYFVHAGYSQTPVWPIRTTPVLFYQVGATEQNLIAKVKYTGRNNKAVLQNQVYNFNCNTFSTEGVATNQYYVIPFSSFRISLLRILSTGVYQTIFVPGSATSYGRDFESDTLDNFFILADNNGNTWDTAFHAPPLSNRTDSTQLLLYKIDTFSKVSWFKFYGGTSAEYAKCLKKTSDGNLLVLASTQSNNGDVTNHQGGKDIWLLKINSTNGNIMWQKTFGSAADEVPADMEVLPDGSIVIAGAAQASSFFPDPRSQDNAFLLKLDANGNVVWKKTFGGNGMDRFRNLVPVNDGGFAGIGITNSGDGDLPPGFGGTDVFITKHSPDGTLQWLKLYGNSDNDEPGDIVYTACDSSIFASYAKQYSFAPYPPIPAFAQVTGVEVGLRNNGTQFHFVQNNYAFPISEEATFNEGFTFSMAPNDRGGFLGGYIYHKKWPLGTPPGGCRYTRSFHIVEYGEKAATRIILDTTVCKGALVQGHTITKDTTLISSMQNACGIDTLVRQQNIHVSDLFLNAPAELTFTPGVPIVLSPSTNGTITWQPAATLSCSVCQTAIATPIVPVRYFLSAQKNGCTVYDTISMVQGNGYSIYIPTAFTPNGDGLNDRFNAIASGLQDYEMKIFNRWGQHIFTTKSLIGGWDGTIRGRRQATNTFVYLIQIATNTGERLLYKGTFTLIR